MARTAQTKPSTTASTPTLHARSALGRWESATARVMMVFSVSWLVVATMLAVNPTSPTADLERAALFALWAVFAVDVAIRLWLAPRKGAFIRHNLLDVGSVVLPFLRPFHLVTDLRRLQFFRNASNTSIRVGWIINAMVLSVLFVYTISLAVLVVERESDSSNIATLGDALWWSIVTIATVGYGDLYPVTVMGRVLGSILILGGIIIVGVATGTVISALNDAMVKAKPRHERVDEIHAGPSKGARSSTKRR